MSESAPPPIYSQEDPDDTATRQEDTVTVAHGPQILIFPTADSINFQKGYLGADGERAAIEGELQIKGAEEGRWGKVTMTLRTIETAYEREIELGSSELVLFSSAPLTTTTLPSSFPFAIPLTPDTPQSIHTPQSLLFHTLTAALHPSDPLLPALSKTITVHTRRYTSHSHTLAVSPETHSLVDPTRVDVQVPRTTFKAGEAVPIYVSVPPPSRELVVDKGLRLRNVRAELVRVVKVKREEGEDDIYDAEADMLSDGDGNFEELLPSPGGPSTSNATEKLSRPLSSSKAPNSPLFLGSSYRTVITRSGASCRFHSSKTVQLRFILHQPSPFGSPSDFQVNLPSGEYGKVDSDSECASITQTTLLHSVTFRLNIHVSFVDTSTRTERFSTISIPLVIIAPPAALPEVEQSVDAAYQKKHDRPPAKTVRHDDDFSIPHYNEREAGPSVLPNGAPPPFEERDAPPPFFSSEPEASTSSHLPTFLESETEIIVPHGEQDSLIHPPHAPSPSILGEGVLFGFKISEQFDGHSEVMQRTSTPPPPLEMATKDTDLTELADINEPERAMEALGLVLELHEGTAGGAGGGGAEELLPPPPPPAMDDPLDPPPSIDSDFRSPVISRQNPPSPHPTYSQLAEPPSLDTSPPPTQDQSSDSHAPPPYLIPDNERDGEHVMRPPPYMDCMPSE